MLPLLFLCLMGITQPGGAGTTIFVYDDSINAGGTDTHVAGQPHTFSEIAASFPANFTDLGTNQKSYRSQVSVQTGDAGVGSATTTITDTNNSIVVFDNTKTLLWRATQTTSWNLNLGTKVGSGNIASGKSGTTLVFGAATSFRGNMGLYGCNVKTTTGAVSFSNAVGTTVDIQNCLFQSVVSAGSAPFVPQMLGTANLYNVDFSHATASFVMSSFILTTAERITACATSPTAFLQTGIATLAVKDFKMIGTPTTSDIRISSAGPINWQLVRPVWTGLAPKFSTASNGNPSLSAAVWEYWLWDVKCVDRTGAAISGIPVTLTDVTGEVQVSTTTGSDGQVTFGSGLTANAVKVMDHYFPSVPPSPTYTQRTRSPFYVTINVGAGSNPNYQSKRYYFNWPGGESVTTSSGSFEDVADVIALEDPSGSPTSWVERVAP